MDWNGQMEEMMRSWTNMQRHMWDNWTGSMKRFSSEMPEYDGEMQQEFANRLDAWEASVNQVLEAQTDWTRNWAARIDSGTLTLDGVENQKNQWQRMMQDWADTQQKLWSAWFESMRTIDPPRSPSQWKQETQQAMEAWQQAAGRAQEILVDWAQVRGKPVTETSAETGSSRKHKTSSQGASSATTNP